jgi:hypothetical protein
MMIDDKCHFLFVLLFWFLSFLNGGSSRPDFEWLKQCKRVFDIALGREVLDEGG